MKPRRPGNTSWSGNRHSFPKATRAAILNRDNHQCQLRYDGCIGTATEADHIRNVANGGNDSKENGQAVCVPCHKVKTRREQQEGIAKRSRYRPKAQHPGLT